MDRDEEKQGSKKNIGEKNEGGKKGKRERKKVMTEKERVDNERKRM